MTLRCTVLAGWLLASAALAAADRPADVRFRAGDVAGAQTLLEARWQDHVAAGTTASPTALQVLFDLGACHLRLGQLGRARLCFERAVDGFETLRPPDEGALALALEGLVAVLVAQENTTEARVHLERARSIRARHDSPTHPQMARLEALEARLARIAGQPAAARLALDRARQAYRLIHGNLHPTVAALVSNDTDLHLELNNPLDAQLMAHQSDYITREVFGTEAPERVATLAALGRVQWELGEHRTSVQSYRQALAILDAHDRVSILEVAACEAGLGRSLLAGGESAEALPAFDRAAEAYEQAWWLAGRGPSRATFMASPYPLLAGAELIAGAADDPDAAARAWLALERHHGRSLWLAGWSSLLSATERAQRDSLQQRSLALTRQIERLAVAGSAERLAALRRERTDLGATLLQLDATLRERLAAIDHGPPAIPREVPPGTALLGWLDVRVAPGEVRSWAWVITATGGLRWVTLADGGEVASLAASYREAIVTAGAQTADLAARLFALRLEPCLPWLDGISTLIVVPGEALAGVPLAALRDADGRPVVERWSVAVAPRAGSVARRGARPAPNAQSLLAVADPPFTAGHAAAMQRGHPAEVRDGNLRSVMTGVLHGDTDLLQQLARLPGTRDEVKAVARLFTSTDLLIGEAARKDALIQRQAEGRLSRYDVIHLATHALVDAEQSDRSALVLSLVDRPPGAVEPPGEARDGLLSVGEIAANWHLTADLVTLSACETGLGRSAPGEGYLGFTQAFLAAGASSVLVSLWQVDDRATALLMQRFYENRRLRAHGKAEALREAQLWLRDYRSGSRRPFAHPRYWAAFMLVGES